MFDAYGEAVKREEVIVAASQLVDKAAIVIWKEIHEQPDAIAHSLAMTGTDGRIAAPLSAEQLRDINGIAGCPLGLAIMSLVARYWIEIGTGASYMRDCV